MFLTPPLVPPSQLGQKNRNIESTFQIPTCDLCISLCKGKLRSKSYRFPPFVNLWNSDLRWGGPFGYHKYFLNVNFIICDSIPCATTTTKKVFFTVKKEPKKTTFLRAMALLWTISYVQLISLRFCFRSWQEEQSKKYLRESK